MNRAKVKEAQTLLQKTEEEAAAEVAQVSMEEGYATIERAQRRRVVKVTADVDEATTNAAEVRRNLENSILPGLKQKYLDIRYDLEGEAREQRESLADILKGFSLALCAIYVLLAIPFRSFSQPLIIMTAIPFGIVGLSGVVVNDSLLLIHTTNGLVKQGRPPREAIRQAGPLRFRPVMLTSVTTL